MEQSIKPRIIELNGLAGCGKTTLTRQLKDQLTSQGYRVILLGEAYLMMKKQLLKNALLYFRCVLLFRYIKLFMMSRNNVYDFYFNMRYIYWVQLKISLIYNWFLKSGEFDYLLCDHGMLQNIISVLGFKELKNKDRIKESLKSLLKAENEIFVVNCNISVEQSVERIRNRKKTTGRLDAVRNDIELKKLLRTTENHFIILRNLVKRVRNEWQDINLEMETPIEINVQKITNLLTLRNKINEFEY